MSQSNGQKLRVAVLMGGTSSERKVSLSTGAMIVRSLDPNRYEVMAADTQDILALTGSRSTSAAPQSIASRADETSRPEDDNASTLDGEALRTLDALAPLPGSFAGQRPDVVFIALHGKGGEDGAIQGFLDLLQLPYTGSGILSSALAMDKAMAKQFLSNAGVPMLPDITVWRGHVPPEATLQEEVQSKLGGFPVFVKPNAEGSTVGCSLVSQVDQLSEALAVALTFDPIALIEQYARGTEITVGVLGNTGGPLEALPIIEIVPRSEFYDYDSKYAEGGSEHLIPARISDSLTQRAQEIALRCHTLLRCRGMSRTDMIVVGDTLVVLEVNTIPGMTPTSLLPQAADHAGISFSQLLDRLIELALQKE